MQKLLKPITSKEFNFMKEIEINNISEGFKKYSNGILDVHEHGLTLSEDENTSNSIETYNLQHEEKFISFMKNVYEINKSKPLIIDFYLKDIDSAGILRILNYLDYNDKLIFIEQIKHLNTDSVYFLIEDENLIPFITKLSTRELHFCTFHFIDRPITIWGNYKLSFPVFFKSFNDIKFYKDIARQNNLFMRNISLQPPVVK